MSGASTSRLRPVGRAILRRLPLLGTLVGIGLAIWLVATNDLAAVAAAFGKIGVLGFAGVTLVRAIIVLLCGLAWARILDGLSPAPTIAFLILRFVREGINVLLPVASVGGDVLGARLLTFWGVAGALAAASILADMLLQVGTLALFAGLGAGLLTRVEGAAAADLAHWTLRALAIAGLLLAAFFALQRTGIAHRLEARVVALGRRFVRETEARPDPAPRVQGALDAVWGPGRRGHLAESLALHALAWLLGAAEIAIVLACIGVDVGLSEVLVIEAMGQAIKAVAFLIPSGLGVQEGGLVLVCGLFGIDAGTALALSLAKRVPDVVLGLPALLVWQNLEARRAGVQPGPAPR
ncbi:lysylphosphatidylglycerol synthase domain-containing protein [Methylobacterium sp. NEAU 140]|uniref:lysylphosphatidylglycerol synthase domain-containing protein n=1 Tax=Methylobacterium sp. NEAU 140 TaxID=3064945 RepID=UPI002735EF8D|nr:lysylphosphatidylglycerol synthase domain-containing protein [Methylobacterium sp. NEAU 140]MDP4025537.1 lysylphosphatidylglycerol synthase domain-containing protein [Methylobacterium sp. NEAU 140]